MLDRKLNRRGYLFEKRIEIRMDKTAGPPIFPETRQEIQQASAFA
jgi:hypothetical protein